MKLIGNILWLILGGLLIALVYYLIGLLMCITIIGIPFGVQLFKLGTFSLWPFGRQTEYGPGEPGCISIVMNLIWILLGWWEVEIPASRPSNGPWMATKWTSVPSAAVPRCWSVLSPARTVR